MHDCASDLNHGSVNCVSKQWSKIPDEAELKRRINRSRKEISILAETITSEKKYSPRI